MNGIIIRKYSFIINKMMPFKMSIEGFGEDTIALSGKIRNLAVKIFC